MSSPEAVVARPEAPVPGARHGGVRVFVSHAGTDVHWAEWVAWQLEHAGLGYVVELDAWDWSPGENFVTRMDAALERADVVVALWSSAYFDSSRFTTAEWTSVIARRSGARGATGTRLVPLRIEDVTPPAVLRPLIAPALFGLPDEAAMRAVVLRALAGSGRPETAPPVPEYSAAPGRAGSPLEGWCELPRDIADFTGRDDLVDRLDTLLTPGSSVPVVAISGQGGVGKTALAVHVGHRLAARYPDGQLYVDLRGAERTRVDPSVVLADFLGQLGVPGAGLPATLEDRARLFRSRVSGHRVLVLLDNAASEAQVRPLMPGSPGCAVLVTSRSRLSALEGAENVDLRILRPDESMALLGRVAGAERVGSDESAARRLVELCGHLPLAVRIAGARLQDRRHWTLARYVARLADERRRLGELHTRDDDIRAVFALGYDGRSPGERRAFRLLGLVRSASVAAWSAAALLDTSPLDAEDLLEALAEAQLLEVLDDDEAGSGGPTRYRLHDLLRLYATERLEDEEPAAERHQATVRLLEACVGYGHRANAAIERWPTEPYRSPPTGPRPPWWDEETVLAVDGDPSGWLSRECAGLVTAVRQAHEAGLWEQTWELAAALPTILEWRADWSDWESVLELSRDAAERAGDPRRRAVVLDRLARFAWDRDDWAVAEELFDQCVEVLDGLSDPRLDAIVERGRGELWRDQGRWQSALDAYVRSLAYFRSAGERHWVARIVGNIGDVHRDLGEWDEAHACYDECLGDFRALGDPRSVAITLRSLGDVHRDRGSPARGISCYDDALGTFWQIGDVRWQAFTLRARAVAHGLLDHRSQAIADAEQAMTIFRQVADRRGEAIVLRILGDLHASSRAFTAALDLYRSAVLILTDLGDERTGALTQRCLGRAYHQLEERDAALGEYEQSRDVLRRLGDTRGMALVEEDLDRLRAGRGPSGTG